MRRYTRDEWSEVFDDLLGELMPGGSPQTTMQESTVQNYRMGCRMGLKDGRAYRYSFAVTALRGGWGCQDGGDIISTTLNSGAQAAGRTVIVPDGGFAIAINHFQNGYLAIENALGDGLTCFFSKILSNLATDGTHVVLTLEHPTQAALLAQNCTIVSSPWARCTRMMTVSAVAAKLTSVVGVPMFPITINNFFWAQTWGPIAGLPVAFMGGTEFERWVQFHDTDGSMRPATIGGQPYQHAGFLIGSNAVGAPAGVDPRNIMMWLQITP